MKSIHLFISGFVQGVGYRKFLRHEAEKRNLTGWVRNLPDGRVEAVIVGLEKLLKEMIILSKKGPFLSEVENVQVEWGEPVSYIGFVLRHDLD